MPVINFEQYKPQVGRNIFLAPTAYVIGKVSLADDISVFFGAVLRGDINNIIIGKGTNIQENCVLHTSHGLGDTIVGSDVTVGHQATLHGCKIADRCIIGMNSVILDDAEILEDCIIGANSLVPMGKKYPARSLILGSPAKVVRELTDKELLSIVRSAERYREKAQQYRQIFS